MSIAHCSRGAELARWGGRESQPGHLALQAARLSASMRRVCVLGHTCMESSAFSSSRRWTARFESFHSGSFSCTSKLRIPSKSAKYLTCMGRGEQKGVGGEPNRGDAGPKGGRTTGNSTTVHMAAGRSMAAHVLCEHTPGTRDC